MLSRHLASAACAGCVLTLVVACNNGSSSNDAGPTCASPGGAASGPADSHCTLSGRVQPTNPSSCYIDASAGDDGGMTGDDGGMTGDDGGMTGDDGGTVDIGNCGNSAYGATMYGQQGSDDDCKYDVTWTSTPICEGQPVYFTVSATNKSDHSLATGANIRPDVVLNCSHPIPNDPAPADPSPENPPGTYKVGPVVFDQPGKWVVRFHLNENCFDIAPDSPHGHAAFYVQVP